MSRSRTVAGSCGRGLGVAAMSGLLLTCALPRATIAQAAAPPVLTLDDAIARATGDSPVLRRATNSAGLNGVELRTTWLDQLLPSASLTLFNTAFTGNLQRQAFDNYGNPIANPQADWNFFSQTSHRLNLSWEIQGRSLFQSYTRQAWDNLARDFEVDRTRFGLELDVRSSYLDALEQRALREVEIGLIEARGIDLEVARRLFSISLRTRVDVLAAEVEVEQQRVVASRQDGAYKQALLRLSNVIGAEDGDVFEVADVVLPLFDPGLLEETDLVRLALESSPDLRSSGFSVRSAELGVAERRNDWWPQLAMGIDLYRRAYLPEGRALFDPTLDGQLESQFYMQFSIPVLNRYFSQRLSEARASVELNNERERNRETRLGVEAEVRGALLALHDEWAAYRLSERATGLAEEALRLAREEYRLGMRTFEQLRSGFEQEAETRRQTILARHAFADALLRLERVVGRPVTPEAGSAGGR